MKTKISLCKVILCNIVKSVERIWLESNGLSILFPKRRRIGQLVFVPLLTKLSSEL